MADKVTLDTLTGGQFKQLIEKFTQDGKIDTIPELIRVLSDIPEDKTLGQYIAEHGGQVDPQVVQDAVDEAFVEQQASDDDIDSIFEEEEDEAGYDANAEKGEDDV